MYCLITTIAIALRHETSLTTTVQEKFILRFVMYAGDATMSYSTNNIDGLNDNLNSDLNSLRQWLRGNKLS